MAQFISFLPRKSHGGKQSSSPQIHCQKGISAVPPELRHRLLPVRSCVPISSMDLLHRFYTNISALIFMKNAILSFPTDVLFQQKDLWNVSSFTICPLENRTPFFSSFIILCNIMAEDLACCVFGSYFFHSAIHPFAYNCCLRSQSSFLSFRIYTVLLHQLWCIPSSAVSIFDSAPGSFWRAGSWKDDGRSRKVVRSFARRSEIAFTFSFRLSRADVASSKITGSADSSESSQWKDRCFCILRSFATLSMSVP